MIHGRRKDLLDDNNYINKFGKITHVCPMCGAIYSSTLKLSVNCTIINCKATEDKSYRLETPAIKKECECCHMDAVQIDNSVADIYKVLVQKGYKIANICEGHVYTSSDNLNTYALPYIKIEGNIKAAIPEAYRSKVGIVYDDGHTFIGTNKTYEDACVEFEDVNLFNTFKCETLNNLLELVRVFPLYETLLTNDDACTHNHHKFVCDCIDRIDHSTTNRICGQ